MSNRLSEDISFHYIYIYIYIYISMICQNLCQNSVSGWRSLELRNCIQCFWYSTEAFTPQRLLHREAFTDRRLYTEKPLQKEMATHSIFRRGTPLHAQVFTCRSFFTQTQWRGRFSTQRLLQSDRCLCTQKLLHRSFYGDAVTQPRLLLHRGVFTGTPIHREAFTQISF